MNNTEKPRPSSGKQQRKRQLSEALRANLKRRKKQPSAGEKQS